MMPTSSPIQIPLLKPQLLEPLPIGDRHYVAVLQSKTGEREALRHASSTTWERLTPLIEVVGPKNPKPPLTRTSVAAWIKRVADAVAAHPFYLDILRLEPTLAVAGKNGEEPVLGRMYAEARKRRMRFVPVAHVSESTKQHLQLVGQAVLEDGNGVALRYRMRTVTPSAGLGHDDVLRAHLSDLGVAVEEADLLVDLEYLDEDVEVDPEDIAAGLREMCDVGQWRSLVVIGTSMPKMLSCVREGTLGSIPRREWDLWSGLSRYDLRRMPAFGDYAVQNPEPPADDVGGNTMRANIRYTTATETLVARGRGPVSQEGKEQYRGLCQQLVARAEFAGPAYSWGDEVIDDCARGAAEPEAQNLWRGAGTSHHLRAISEQLASQPRP
jgi:hypothetical protein